MTTTTSWILSPFSRRSQRTAPRMRIRCKMKTTKMGKTSVSIGEDAHAKLKQIISANNVHRVCFFKSASY